MHQERDSAFSVIYNNIWFFLFHLVILLPFFTNFAWKYVWWMLASYYIRMFFITGFIHRYFSHRTFKTSRFFQFIMAFLSQTAGQRGVLWWAAHHRYHHGHSDKEDDVHSAKQDGFWYSHVLWFLQQKEKATQWRYIKDLSKYKELVWLNKYHMIPMILYGIGWYYFAGWMGLLWGFGISTIVLYHGTYCVNSIAHLIGKKRFPTTDNSKNSWIVTLLTLGEGWHNNHHYYQQSTRNGFYWWEIDVTYYLLQLLRSFGLIWHLNPVPAHIYEQAKR